MVCVGWGWEGVSHPDNGAGNDVKIIYCRFNFVVRLWFYWYPCVFQTQLYAIICKCTYVQPKLRTLTAICYLPVCTAFSGDFCVHCRAFEACPQRQVRSTWHCQSRVFEFCRPCKYRSSTLCFCATRKVQKLWQAMLTDYLLSVVVKDSWPLFRSLSRNFHFVLAITDILYVPCVFLLDTAAVLFVSLCLGYLCGSCIIFAAVFLCV